MRPPIASLVFWLSLAPLSVGEVLTGHLASIYQSRGLGISFEIVEIDPVSTRKQNNLHERLSA